MGQSRVEGRGALSALLLFQVESKLGYNIIRLWCLRHHQSDGASWFSLSTVNPFLCLPLVGIEKAEEKLRLARNCRRHGLGGEAGVDCHEPRGSGFGPERAA